MVDALPAPFTPDLKVLVLAGSNPVSERRRRNRARRSEREEPEVPLENKAFLPLHGRLVIEYMLDTLEACGLQQVWILGQEYSLRRIPARYRFTPLPQEPEATLVANLASAYGTIAPADNEPALVIFGDHPLTTPAALRAFLVGCAPDLERADFFHALATREAYAEYSPFFRRTSVHTREVCGRASGLSLAIPSRLHRLRALDDIYDVRKQERFGSFLSLLWRAATWLGPRSPLAVVDCTLLSLAKETEKLGRRGRIRGRIGRTLERGLQRLVPKRRLESYGARILQAEKGARLVPLAHGGAGIDVDFSEELAMIEEHWDQLARISDRQDAALRPQGDRTSISSR